MSTPHVDRYTVVRQPDGRYSVVDMARHVDVLVDKPRVAAHQSADDLNAGRATLGDRKSLMVYPDGES